jgi:uncharacterized protein YbjT (DUF2867 family)
MILVTGATGKVGRHLVAGLLAEGAAVRALTRGSREPALPADAEIARWDPAQPATCFGTWPPTPGAPRRYPLTLR